MPACKTKQRPTSFAPFRVRGGRAVRTHATGAPHVLGKADSHETDVVVIGAGIGGLSCAALLAKYGLQVTVLESHTILGGAAHVRCQALLHHCLCTIGLCARSGMAICLPIRCCSAAYVKCIAHQGYFCVVVQFQMCDRTAALPLACPCQPCCAEVVLHVCRCTMYATVACTTSHIITCSTCCRHGSAMATILNLALRCTLAWLQVEKTATRCLTCCKP